MTKLFALLVALCFVAACSLRPGSGSAQNGGSDIVQPLWNEQSLTALPADTLACANVVALLIGIGDYNPANGWENLSGQRDVDLMVTKLRQRGVPRSHIHTLLNGQATKTGIEKALQTLADTLSPGSQLIVLYAGHARQLPDDNGDEADGYDEAIVPYDAPPANRNAPEGYLRDDELNRYLTQIRTRLGPAGSLWLLFDSCHAQTLNRGQQRAQHQRGGIAPLGPPASKHPQRAGSSGSDWYETPPQPVKLATYVLFSATSDGSPNFETTDASGRSLGPLTRAVAEVWGVNRPGETYRSLFQQVAVAMARFALYQQPGLEGDADTPLPSCGSARSAAAFGYQTTGERLRVAWPRQDAGLTNALVGLPFVQRAANHPDLSIEHRSRGYRLSIAATNRLLSVSDLSVGDCVERIRQYFARNVLLQFQQTSPDFGVGATLQRVAVQTGQGRTAVVDTLPNLTASGLPAFRTSPQERAVLTLTNTGPKPAYLTVVDLQPDGTLHVLLPEAGLSTASCYLLPGQRLSRRIRLTEPLGAEIYKLLLTPEPIDLRAVLQTRGNASIYHPYEQLFQRTYTTRGLLDRVPLSLSAKSGATAELAFWVMN